MSSCCSLWDAIGAVGALLRAKPEHWIGALFSSALGAVFAAGRATLSSTPLTRVAVIADQTNPAARAALLRYLGNPIRVQSRWLVGRVLCTALTAALLADAIAQFSSRWGVITAVLGTLGTYGTLTEIGIVVARRSSDRTLVVLLRFLRPLELAMAAFALPFAGLASLAQKVLPPPPASQSRTAEQEVEMLLAESTKAGTIGPERAQMIRNVLEFSDLTAADVMVPRTALIGMPAEHTVSEALRLVASVGHSRYPVYRESIDNIVGLLYAKDLFKLIQSPENLAAPIESIARAPVNFVPETQPISALLREMKVRRLHMAVVVDDYGGVSGIVTLEDIIEEIMGDIQDEHDRERSSVVQLGGGRILVDASMPLDDLREHLGIDIPNDGGDYVSLGGMLVSEAGRVPQAGAQVEAHGYRFVVREADDRRIMKVEIRSVGGVLRSSNPQLSRSSDKPQR